MSTFKRWILQCENYVLKKKKKTLVDGHLSTGQCLEVPPHKPREHCRALRKPWTSEERWSLALTTAKGQGQGRRWNGHP